MTTAYQVWVRDPEFTRLAASREIFGDALAVAEGMARGPEAEYVEVVECLSPTTSTGNTLVKLTNGGARLRKTNRAVWSDQGAWASVAERG